jgi:predicted phage terminase large subunit-like protein
MDFVRRTFPDFQESWHHRMLCERLQQFSDDVAAQKSPRLIVTMPPRHTKSTIVSQRFPVWHMGRHAGHDVVCASYGQTLANRHSRAARGIAVDASVLWPGVAPSQERKAVEEWEVSSGGTYRATGVGGGLTGMGAHVAVIDDPIKDWVAAQSALVRQSAKDWYDSVLMTRLAPGAGILVTQTRWHSDDLTGWLLREHVSEGWELFNFPAIAEEDEAHRKTGDALHPERYNLAKLNAIKVRNPMVFAALYQQRPVPAEGGLIKAEWLRKNTYAERAHMSKVRRILHSWDTASKAKEINDPSLCWVLAELHDGTIEVWDRWKGRVVFPDLLQQIRILADRDKPHVVIIEDKGSGQEAIPMLARDTRFHHSVVPAVPITDKHTRMAVETPALASGRVKWPEDAPWLADAWEVLLTFPSAAHDEEVDALSQALHYLRDGDAIASRLRVLYG